MNHIAKRRDDMPCHGPNITTQPLRQRPISVCGTTRRLFASALHVQQRPVALLAHYLSACVYRLPQTRGAVDCAAWTLANAGRSGVGGFVVSMMDDCIRHLQLLTFFCDSGIQEVGIAQRHPPAQAPPGRRPGVTSGPEWASLYRVKQPRPNKRRPGGASPVRRDPRLFLQNRAPRTPAVPAGGPFAPIVPGAPTGEPRGRRS